MTTALRYHAPCVPGPETSSHCARSRTTRSTCTQCIEACPLDAIEVSAAGRLEITAACTDCEICIAACAFDGLQHPRERAERRVRSAAARTADGTPVVFACVRAQHPGAESVPCVASVSRWELLELLGRADVIIPDTDCDDCPLAQSASAWWRDAESINRMAAGMRMPGRIVRMPRDHPLLRRLPRGLSRRGLVRSLLDQRRTTLAGRTAIIERIGSTSVDVIPAALFPFGDVTVSSACLGCTTCADVCPEAAIHRTMSDEAFVLSFDAAMCSGCGACADSCAARAITVWRRPAAVHRRVLVRLPVRACDDCADLFASSGDALCPGCRNARTEQRARYQQTGGTA